MSAEKACPASAGPVPATLCTAVLPAGGEYRSDEMKRCTAKNSRASGF